MNVQLHPRTESASERDARLISAWPGALSGALVIGSNKRYAAQIDTRMFAHVDEMMMRGTPQTLTDAELELGVYPLTRTPLPVQAQAWVRYGDLATKVDVEVVAWTPRAVAVRWMTPTGQQHRAWVWASAVERQR